MGRILVVDDEPGVPERFTSFLSAEGYDVRSARSVDEALDALAREEFDVVVSNIVMAARSGIELLALVRQLTPGAKVILITGQPSVESAAEAIRHGAADYLTKPVTGAALVQSVQATLNVKSLQNEARAYRQRLETLLEERNRQVQMWERCLHELAEHVRGLGTSAGLSELAPEVLRTLASLTHAESGSFYVREGSSFVLVAGHHAPHATARINLPARPGSVTQRLLASPQPLLVRDAAVDLGLSGQGSGPYRDGSFVGLPCVGGGGEVEALIFLYNRWEGAFTEQDLAIGLLVAARVEEAMRTANLLRALEEAEARRRLTQPQVLLEQVEHIFRTVRHEIGNALNTLKTTLAVLRTNAASFNDAKREEYFARCFESLRLAEKMLHALRAFERFDQATPVRVELCRYLIEKEGFIFAAARQRGATCSLELGCCSAEVRADPDTLLRILLNLGENATTATVGRPDATIRVSCEVQGEHVVLEVSDNGVGVPFELQKRVFEPLFSTKPDGSGMGLAIAQKLVAKLNGTIDLRSEPGAGTWVAIRLSRAVGLGDGLPGVERSNALGALS